MHFELLSAICFNLDQSKILLSGNGLNIAKMTISVCEMVEHIMGKGENADNQHFLLFPPCFRKTSLSGLLNGTGSNTAKVIMIGFVFESVESIVENEKMVVTSIQSFPIRSSKRFFLRVIKIQANYLNFIYF